MSKYTVKGYQKGFEPDQVRIGRAVAQNWIWPYAYDLQDLLEAHAQPDFDPGTRHYCFLGGEMVGYTVSIITAAGDGGLCTANLDFPRMMPGHEEAAPLLIEAALETLKSKGVSRVVGRVTTMVPGDIRLAEDAGFSIGEWGYKVYYSYEMAWGRLDIPVDAAEEVDPEQDLEECARLAARWYRRSPEWCHPHLRAWHKAGIITHAGVRQGSQLIAACPAAPNDVRRSTAGIFYIYAADAQSLRRMLVRVVNRSVDYGVDNVMADLIHEHRQYESVYRDLGFRKAAEWARCEKALAPGRLPIGTPGGLAMQSPDGGTDGACHSEQLQTYEKKGQTR
jgi:hypothetical protein